MPVLSVVGLVVVVVGVGGFVVVVVVGVVDFVVPGEVVALLSASAVPFETSLDSFDNIHTNAHVADVLNIVCVRVFIQVLRHIAKGGGG